MQTNKTNSVTRPARGSYFGYANRKLIGKFKSRKAALTAGAITVESSLDAAAQSKYLTAIRKKLVKEYEGGATLSQLSVKFDIGLPLVRRELDEFGVEIRKKGGASFDSSRDDQIVSIYLEGDKTYEEIGQQFGLTRERVRQILVKRNVKNTGRRSRQVTKVEKKIAAAYDSGTRPAELMKQYPDLTYVAIQGILKRAGVEKKPKGFFNRRSGYDETREGVVRDYLRGDDTVEIAARYGLCGPTEIYKFLKRENVPVRQVQREG